MLTTIAVILYLAAAGLAGKAGMAANQRAKGARVPGWHTGVWLAVSVLFLALAVSRYFGLEESLRIWLRSGLQAEGVYDTRRDMQSVLASLAIVAGTIGVTAGFALMLRSRVLQRAGLSRIVAVAGLAGAAMVMLVVVRIVSLHMLDMLLYRGPRMNWIVDIGSTATVAVAAVRYWRMPLHTARR